MTGRSSRNRHVPPKGNPDEGQQQQSHTATPPIAAIPWRMLIITTGVTTVTGYLFLEGIRSLHRYLRSRGEAIASSANPPHAQEQIPPGSLPSGAFQLPLPDGELAADLSGPPHGGFGSPRLSDVSTPIGRLQHDVSLHQRNMDARLARIERMLSQHYGATG